MVATLDDVVEAVTGGSAVQAEEIQASVETLRALRSSAVEGSLPWALLMAAEHVTATIARASGVAIE